VTTYNQAFVANPIVTLLDTDIWGVSRSPYAAAGDDAGLSWAVLSENVRDLIAGFIVGGSNISVVHNDGANTLTVTFTGTVPASTTDLPEGTNLYFTNARADARIAAAVGVSVQAQNARLQDVATNLSATSGTVEKTGANTFGVYTVTAAGKALIDDADATAQRTTLGLGTIAIESQLSWALLT
jgi:hypothetical protein